MRLAPSLGAKPGAGFRLASAVSMRTMRSVTPLFARTSFHLHPIARSRVVPLLAFVLALALLTSGLAAAAQPLAIVGGGAAQLQQERSATAKAAPCAHHAQASRAGHPDRHAGDCCNAKLCACAPACIGWWIAAAAPLAFPPAANALPVAAPPAVHAIAAPPPLRPPIA